MSLKAKSADKLITVPTNGQISIGTKWAGKQVRIQELSENEIHISSGTFIPDSQKQFFTKESLESLQDFETWIDTNPTPKESASKTMAKLRKQRQTRGK
jgi:hypothetical protein